MLHYVHQLVSNCVCLLFAAEQVVYIGLHLHSNELFDTLYFSQAT